MLMFALKQYIADDKVTCLSLTICKDRQLIPIDLRNAALFQRPACVN